MPEFSQVFAATVRDGIKGATQQIKDERKTYLQYLDERQRGDVPTLNEFAELVTLLDRGVLDTEDIQLERLEISGEYEQTLTVGSEGTGSISVQVGPARLALSGSQSRERASTTNLRVMASYRTRPRSDYLNEARNVLPPLPAIVPTPDPTP